MGSPVPFLHFPWDLIGPAAVAADTQISALSIRRLQDGMLSVSFMLHPSTPNRAWRASHVDECLTSFYTLWGSPPTPFLVFNVNVKMQKGGTEELEAGNLQT